MRDFRTCRIDRFSANCRVFRSPLRYRNKPLASNCKPVSHAAARWCLCCHNSSSVFPMDSLQSTALAGERLDCGTLLYQPESDNAQAYEPHRSLGSVLCGVAAIQHSISLLPLIILQSVGNMSSSQYIEIPLQDRRVRDSWI